MGYLALPYPIQQLRVGEVSTESKLFTVPCDGDVKLDCSCVPDQSAASFGNSSKSFSETNNSISITNIHKSLKLYKEFEILDEPPCYKPQILVLWSCECK